MPLRILLCIVPHGAQIHYAPIVPPSTHTPPELSALRRLAIGGKNVDKSPHLLEHNGFLSIDFLCRTYAEILLIFHEVAREQGFSDYTHVIPSINSPETFQGIATTRDVIKRAVTDFKALCSCRRDTTILSMDEIIQQIKDYLDQNFDNDIALQLFSEKYYLSKEYLSKQFKEKHQYGIYEYLLVVRMNYAGQALTATTLKIQEIANRCGYNDTNYFSKAFKSYYGVSPKEYRHNESGV